MLRRKAIVGAGVAVSVEKRVMRSGRRGLFSSEEVVRMRKSCVCGELEAVDGGRARAMSWVPSVVSWGF